MKTADIILWTFSLLLGVLSIVFGIIASISSTKANNKIETLINTSFIADETQKYFFNHMKTINVTSKKILSYLEEEKATFHDYSLISSETRFSPMPQKTKTVLLESEYQLIVDYYYDTKTSLDAEFKWIINDYSILAEKKEIPAETKRLLMKYHQRLITEASKIIAQYAQINN